MATSRPPAPEPELGSVLIVDDEAASRHLLGGYLAAVPCQVAEAVDGASALASVAAAPPDLVPPGHVLQLRAGQGWQPGLVGHATLDASPHSQVGYTLLSRAAVIVEDLRTDARFQGSSLLRDHRVVSGLSLSIRGPEGPIGVLGAYTARPRAFTADDIHFLQGIGQVLAT